MDLKVGTTEFSSGTFCHVKLNGDWSPEKFETTYREHLIMLKWCMETFGISTEHVATARWLSRAPYYYFRNESDRTLFLVKWA